MSDVVAVVIIVVVASFAGAVMLMALISMSRMQQRGTRTVSPTPFEHNKD